MHPQQHVHMAPRMPSLADRDEAVSMSDYRKLMDPLTEPGRRVARDQIPPAFVSQWLNLRTQTWDDAPTSVGYLYRDLPDGDMSDMRNRMIRLISKRDRLRSTRYIYYAITKDGIKVQIDPKKDELFDSDSVKIPELGGDFKVKLYKTDDPLYNPYIV
jgi:hypothetical protein